MRSVASGSRLLGLTRPLLEERPAPAGEVQLPLGLCPVPCSVGVWRGGGVWLRAWEHRAESRGSTREGRSLVRPVLTGRQEKRRTDLPLSHGVSPGPVPQEHPLVLRLGQELPGGVPVALKHLQLQEERGPHVPLHQPPERLLGLQSPEQPHGLQAGEAASRQRGAAGEIQLPVVPRSVAGAGLEELAGLVLQGRPQRDRLPRAEALHGDGQRLIEEAADGGREADGGGHGGEEAGGGRPGGPRRAAALRGGGRGAGPGQPLLPAAAGDRPAQGAGCRHLEHDLEWASTAGGGFRDRSPRDRLPTRLAPAGRSGTAAPPLRPPASSPAFPAPPATAARGFSATARLGPGEPLLGVPPRAPHGRAAAAGGGVGDPPSGVAVGIRCRDREGPACDQPRRGGAGRAAQGLPTASTDPGPGRTRSVPRSHFRPVIPEQEGYRVLPKEDRADYKSSRRASRMTKASWLKRRGPQSEHILLKGRRTQGTEDEHLIQQEELVPGSLTGSSLLAIVHT